MQPGASPDRPQRLLTVLWAGALLCIGLVATPAPFATLATADAGRVVSRILAQEAWLSLVLGVTLLLLARRQARQAAQAQGASAFSTDMLLLLGTLFCTVAGYFAIQPLMPAARAGQGPFSFGQLHLASASFFVLKALLVMALAWRVSA
ncbi:DUF4149 domain-containing protein [Aquabacterium sp. OR-4]|uniref:DUF4149 domain-containing protein n=1 Tax=Aquabacterium sp. OR-4 TaxID=2978127 RepID=UPI0021B2AE16|nr:DUF4149 domain-containing protein [Aquabacterium sp. OR-4]MDT7836693.1 DUF4149 domain-containing protein [Aquabacterium sp. OR-4]